MDGRCCPVYLVVGFKIETNCFKIYANRGNRGVHV